MNINYRKTAIYSAYIDHHRWIDDMGLEARAASQCTCKMNAYCVLMVCYHTTTKASLSIGFKLLN